MIIKETWLTRKPARGTFSTTVLLVLLVCLTSSFFLRDTLQASQWMPATQDNVFSHHQWWRAWTALFAHSDFGHLLSNLFLFAPFCYLLIGYFGILLFPCLGILAGGLINMLVLMSMPPQVSLIGISGVVYWMGAAWLTLYALIDTKDSIRRRFAHVLFLTVVLFIPETYKPEISYLSHLYGFMLGVFSALAFYFFHRKNF